MLQRGSKFLAHENPIAEDFRAEGAARACK